MTAQHLQRFFAAAPSRVLVPYPLALLIVVALYCGEAWLGVHRALRNEHFDPIYSAAIVLVTALQSVALFTLYRSTRIETAFRKRLWGAAAVAAIAIVSLVNINPQGGQGDANAYIGYAKLPSLGEAYAPQPHDFGDAFAEVRHWGRALPPCDYGPLWLAFNRITIGSTVSTTQAMLVMRLFNIALLFGLLIAMWRLGIASEIILLAAINPMLWYYYVMQAHNDALAIVLVVAGMSVARRWPWIGAVIAGAAGLVKINFLAIAIAGLVGRRSLRTSLVQIGIIVVIVALGSAFFGGIPYVRAVLGIGHMQAFTHTGALYWAGVALHAAVFIIALIATIAAIFGRFKAPASYSFIGTGGIVSSWYVGWCIPYALRIPRFLPVFFITLPLVAQLLLDPRRQGAIVTDVVLGLIIVLSVIPLGASPFYDIQPLSKSAAES